VPEGETQGAPLPKRTPEEGSQGGGNYLKADALGSRGREFTIAATSWEPDFNKESLIPCLHLGAEGMPEDEELLFKVTTIGNNKVLVDHGVSGENRENLDVLVGHRVYLTRAMVTSKSGGPPKASIQIAEFDGKAVA
jgi:hypothetical protein